MAPRAGAAGRAGRSFAGWPIGRLPRPNRPRLGRDHRRDHHRFAASRPCVAVRRSSRVPAEPMDHRGRGDGRPQIRTLTFPRTRHASSLSWSCCDGAIAAYWPRCCARERSRPGMGRGGRSRLCPRPRLLLLPRVRFEIAPVYAKTPEGRVAPLKPVQIRSRDLDAFKLTRPVRYTPTFILVERGSEIGRIEGYPGDEFFWVRLARLFESLPRSAGARPR